MDQRAKSSWATLPAWIGPALIVETTNDPLFPPAERAILKARYPHARHYSFDDPGHTTALTRAPDYITIMRQFLSNGGTV
jgi:pimeloyl-ACP methyl ester carboxylesterase